jgi:hypothetical protein
MTNFAYYTLQPAHRTIGKIEADGFIERTTEPWVCKWHIDGACRTLEVAYNYSWDGASIPRAGWSVIGMTPGGLADAASLAHDVLYRSEGGRWKNKMMGSTLFDSNGHPVTVDRAESDWLFKELCILAGIKKPRAAAAYAIVRTFGKHFWGGDAPRFSC